MAELFKKHFPKAASDPNADPEWFVDVRNSAGFLFRNLDRRFKQLKSCAGRTVKDRMTPTGPWDMCAGCSSRSVCLRPLPHARRSYTVCDILQSKFHDIVLPGLGLSGADKDNERFKLECLIRDVLVTRNWVSHTTLSIEEMMRGLQSLLHLLHMLPCDAAQLKSVCHAVDACILEFVRCRSSERVFELSLNSLVRLVFKRHCQHFCDAMGEASEIDKAIKALWDQMAKKKVAVTPSIAICRNIAVASRHEVYHGKCSGASLSIMVAMCALSSLFRVLAQLHAFPKVVEAAADACDADVLQLLVRMQLCDVDETRLPKAVERLLKAVEHSHAPMYVSLLPALAAPLCCSTCSPCSSGYPPAPTRPCFLIACPAHATSCGACCLSNSPPCVQSIYPTGLVKGAWRRC